VKIPNKIQCSCFEYSIEEHSRSEMGDSMGDLNRETKVIRITKDLEQQVKKETLLHELLHVTLDDYSIEDDLEEKIVRLLSPRIMELFKRNPKLLEVLFGKEEI